MGALVVVLRRKVERKRKERESYLQRYVFDKIQVHPDSCGYNERQWYTTEQRGQSKGMYTDNKSVEDRKQESIYGIVGR